MQKARKQARDTSASDVGEALSLLSETLTEEETRIREEGASAMKEGAYDTAAEVINFAKQLLAFQQKVALLAGEWAAIEQVRDQATPEVQEIVSKRFFGKARCGVITPHEDYCQPILEILLKMGGSGPAHEVLDLLEAKMRPTLKPVDYEAHQSNSKQIRWRNTAQWARNKMVNHDGRMKNNSPRGLWEISDKGRKWLEKQDRHR